MWFGDVLDDHDSKYNIERWLATEAILLGGGQLIDLGVNLLDNYDEFMIRYELPTNYKIFRPLIDLLTPIIYSEAMGYEFDDPWKADDTKMWSFKVKSGVKDTVSVQFKSYHLSKNGIW